MSSYSPKPLLSGQATWGFDMDARKPENPDEFTITRAFERGNIKDVSQVLSYYGDAKVKKVIVEAKRLNLRAVESAHAILHIPMNEFACFDHSDHLSSAVNIIIPTFSQLKGTFSYKREDGATIRQKKRIKGKRSRNNFRKPKGSSIR